MSIKKSLKNVIKKIIGRNTRSDSGTNYVNLKLNEFDNQRIKQMVEEINNLDNQLFEKKINYNFFEEKFIVIN